MRLLNTTTHTLHEFFGANVPPYAILSHRWSDSEVTFQELQSGNTTHLPGWAKIEGCCSRARQDGYKFVWIDSCCIDKSSSAELSEAINSMFQWYQDAQNALGVPAKQVVHERLDTSGLLAPGWLIFYNCDWVEIGTKSSLHSLISTITGIDNVIQFQRASIAQKMSWASKRETLRPEDMAYCLLGIFGVNMPLLYGEGDKAFLRLQTEIMRVSDDESIFAWYDSTLSNSVYGMVAKSPAAFRDSGDIELLHNDSATPYSMTNKGLQIQLKLIPPSGRTQAQRMRQARASTYGSDTDLFFVPLCCARKGSDNPIALKLIRLLAETEEYARLVCNLLSIQPKRYDALKRTIVIRPSWLLVPTRGSTLIQVLGLQPDIKYNHEVAFYPAVCASGQFNFPDTAPHNFVTRNVKTFVEMETPDGRGLVLELGFGIAMITLASNQEDKGFVLEVEICQEAPPSLGLWLAEDEASVQRLMLSRLTAEQVEAFPKGKVRGALSPGVFVSVWISERTRNDQVFYTINVGLEAEKFDSSAAVQDVDTRNAKKWWTRLKRNN